MINIDDQTERENAARYTTEADAKWGRAIAAGYQLLPDALVRGQRLLKLSSTDVVVILNLNQAWWFSDRLPYLQPATIAKRMGISERSVQRSLSRLRKLGYLDQIRRKQDNGIIRYYHDLSGLRRNLEELALRDFQYSLNQQRLAKEQASDTAA